MIFFSLPLRKFLVNFVMNVPYDPDEIFGKSEARTCSGPLPQQVEASVD